MDENEARLMRRKLAAIRDHVADLEAMLGPAPADEESPAAFDQGPYRARVLAVLPFKGTRAELALKAGGKAARVVVASEGWILGLDGYEPGEDVRAVRIERHDPPPKSGVLETLQQIP